MTGLGAHLVGIVYPPRRKRKCFEGNLGMKESIIPTKRDRNFNASLVGGFNPSEKY